MKQSEPSMVINSLRNLLHIGWRSPYIGSKADKKNRLIKITFTTRLSYVLAI